MTGSAATPQTTADDAVPSYDAVVVGGGPAGATAATDLARQGYSVLLLDRMGRIKPCGGAIPPRLIEEFQIPDALLCAKIDSARIIAPSARSVDMPINSGKDGTGFVGMVNREEFDEWLRNRAATLGAVRRTGLFAAIDRDPEGRTLLRFHPDGDKARTETVRARIVVGADGARSAVARQAVPGGETVPCVFAYHEIVEAPADGSAAARDGSYASSRCDVYYQGHLSPDFYAWVFPHGDKASIGVGSANKGFSLRGAVASLRGQTGLDGLKTIRREGAPIPLKPLKRWDNGRDVILAGDAAGVVAPSSGEGIFYAMISARFVAEAAHAYLATGDARALARARRRFVRVHGGVFWILGMMQHYWYTTDARRERFVSICRDRDVQRLTWDAYMNKELVKADPLAHLRIFLKNLAHLSGLARAS